MEGVGERMLGSTYVHRALQAVSCKQCHPEAKGLPQLPKACPGRRLGRHSSALSPQPDSEHTSPEKTGAEETGEAQGREGMSVAAGHADIALPSLIRSVSGKQSRWRERKGEAQPGESREFLSSPQQVPQTRPLLLLPFPAPSSPLKPAGPQRGECMRQRGEERWAQ